MEDRELLELAAKAAGIKGNYVEDDDWYGTGILFTNEDDCNQAWNPLTDDGDALRLAVKLNMNIFQAGQSAYALPSDDDGTYEKRVRYIDASCDKLAATRRAIVRSAANIGQEMK